MFSLHKFTYKPIIDYLNFQYTHTLERERKRDERQINEKMIGYKPRMNLTRKIHSFNLLQRMNLWIPKSKNEKH